MIKKILIGLIVLSIIGIVTMAHYLDKYKTLYDKELNNVYAYQKANSGLKDTCSMYLYTIDLLRYSKDSLDKKIADVIKNKKDIKEVHYLQSVIYKTDTVKFDSIIFRDSKVNIDTVIGDKWYKVALGLHYPSTVDVSPTFYSEKYIIVNNQKVFNKKPSKIFFIRWFQKKHREIQVEVVEKNPYINSEQNKFIKIIKE